jgi:hypothetical protein
LSAVTGRTITYVPLSMEAFTAALEAERVPAGMVALLRYLFSEVLAGDESADATDGVLQALGRPARDFATFARAAAAAGAWAPGVPAPTA